MELAEQDLLAVRGARAIDALKVGRTPDPFDLAAAALCHAVWAGCTCCDDPHQLTITVGEQGGDLLVWVFGHGTTCPCWLRENADNN
jgi:hypothetical protein